MCKPILSQLHIFLNVEFEREKQQHFPAPSLQLLASQSRCVHLLSYKSQAVQTHTVMFQANSHPSLLLTHSQSFCPKFIFRFPVSPRLRHLLDSKIQSL